jgi:hypothetical protein
MTTHTLTAIGTRVEAQAACVLYDPDNGEVRHLHVVTTLAGGKRYDQDEVAAEALRYVARHAPHAVGLPVLAIEPAELRHGHKIHVDVAAQKLVVTPIADP